MPRALVGSGACVLLVAALVGCGTSPDPESADSAVQTSKPSSEQAGEMPARRAQWKIDAISDRIIRTATDTSGYGFLRLESHPANGQVTIWRSVGSADTDQAIRLIGDEVGIDVQFAESSFAATELEEVGRALKGRNADWAAQGFEVVGWSMRPTGLLVYVRGDVESARAALVGPEIAGIEPIPESVQGPATP